MAKWYQKATVQAALVAGGFLVLVAVIEVLSGGSPPVVVVNPPAQTVIINNYPPQEDVRALVAAKPAADTERPEESVADAALQVDVKFLGWVQNHSIPALPLSATRFAPGHLVRVQDDVTYLKADLGKGLRATVSPVSASIFEGDIPISALPFAHAPGVQRATARAEGVHLLEIPLQAVIKELSSQKWAELVSGEGERVFVVTSVLKAEQLSLTLYANGETLKVSQVLGSNLGGFSAPNETTLRANDVTLGYNVAKVELQQILPTSTERITSVDIRVLTRDDDKEDAQFELEVRQGDQVLIRAKYGAGEDWPDGDLRMFSERLDAAVSGEPIEVIASLRDGPWGRNNHWNSVVRVSVTTSLGRVVSFEQVCAFRTSKDQRHHTISLGQRRFE